MYHQAVITFLRTAHGHLRKDALTRHAAILFVAMLVVNILSLVYQMVASRLLPAPEYTLMVAILGLLTMCSYPLNTFGTAINHHSSLLVQAGDLGGAARLLRKWMLISAPPVLLLCIAILAAAPRIAAMFYLERVAPVVVAALMVPPLLLNPLLIGAAGGNQAFVLTAAAMTGGVLLKLAGGIALIALLHATCGWALAGHGLGATLTFVILATGLFLLLRGHPRDTLALPSLKFYLAQSFLVQLAYAILMTADVVLVAHLIPEADDFAYAATLGRMVVLLPIAVGMAMFPKVSSRRIMTRRHLGIFRRAFVMTALLAASGAVVCAALPRLLLHVLLGVQEVSPSLVLLTRLMAVAMGLSGLLNVTLLLLLAQRRFLACLPVPVAAVLYLACALQFHAAPWQIAAGAVGFTLLALVACLAAIWRVPLSESRLPL